MGFKQIFQCLVLILLAALASACNDNTTITTQPIDNATFTIANAPEIAVGVTDGISALYSDEEFLELVLAIKDVIENRDLNSDSIAGTCATSGTIAFPTGLPRSGTIKGALTFNNFCLSGANGTYVTDDVVFNGDADFEITYDSTPSITKLSLQLSDVIVSKNNAGTTLNGSIVLDNGTLSTALIANYIGSDGRQYNVENLEKTGTVFDGYNIANGTVDDPDYGTVVLKSKSDMFYDYGSCPEGKPISGSVTVTGASSTDIMEVRYDSCQAYTVCLNANAICNQYTW